MAQTFICNGDQFLPIFSLCNFSEHIKFAYLTYLNLEEESWQYILLFVANLKLFGSDVFARYKDVCAATTRIGESCLV